MTLLGELILPADVVLARVAELPSATRSRLVHSPGDWSVTRPRSRTNSIIVDEATVELLDRFRTPLTIVDAVIGYSAEHNRDPRTTLEQAYAVLGGFVRDGILVPAGSDLAAPVETGFSPGARLGDYEIIAPVHVVLDTEVYMARSASGTNVALKLARPECPALVRASFRREAAILGTLDKRVTPTLFDHGDLDGRPFIVTSWCPGVDLAEATHEAHQLGGRAGRRTAIALAQCTLEAYMHLHAQGVLHGDVHPRNVRIATGGVATLIDFGLAAVTPPTSDAPSHRGGIDFFMEPEVARCRLAGRRAPALSASGEQYSVAALLYLVLTGAHTHDFALDPEPMLRQLAFDPPSPFGREDWPCLPRLATVVTRGLAKQATVRYATLADFGAAFKRAAANDARDRPPVLDGHRSTGAARRLLDDVLKRLAVPDGGLGDEELIAPTASVNNGAAGYAYALCRIGGLRGDPSLLAQADIWAARAEQWANEPAGLWSEPLELLPETVGGYSMAHAHAGVHAVATLVAAGRDDESTVRAALDAFVASARAGAAAPHFDVSFGRAGLLLGCAQLLETLSTAIDVSDLKEAGARLLASLLIEMDPQPDIAAGGEWARLGAAHGWAGVLFAILRWSEVVGIVPPAQLEPRLAQLAVAGQPHGRGLRWPQTGDQSVLLNPIPAGWCNGAAGYVPLWTIANRLGLGDHFAELAVGAAWAAYDAAGHGGADLCCGSAGCAYSMLSVYRQEGDDVWLARAWRLADLAAEMSRHNPTRRDSLYKGDVGVALLAADLEHGGTGGMPFFEGDGWPTTSHQRESVSRPE